MSSKQYTIRNVPDQVDRYLRKKAKVSGQSLNQVVIDELSDRAGVGDSDLADSLDWFIGGNTIGDDVVESIAAADETQKKLAEQDWHDSDN